jgi:hypothetical protein
MMLLQILPLAASSGLLELVLRKDIRHGFSSLPVAAWGDTVCGIVISSLSLLLLLRDVTTSKGMGECEADEELMDI